ANGGKRVLISLVILILWIATTVLPGKLASSGPTELVDTAAGGVAWSILAASILLIAAIWWFGWRDLRFASPRKSTLKILWLPCLVLLVPLALVFFLGLPPISLVVLVLFNSLLVGFSEETMFRGVLFRALRGPLSIWPAIIITSIAFGSVHILNGFTTGDFGAATIQAVSAACSGVLLIALLIRTGSIWVPIIYHALWDALLFIMAVAASDKKTAEPAASTVETATGLGHIVVPLLLVMPNFLFALWLLRDVHTKIHTEYE
ncbi:CPBP family intramembrane glutamic endopeptidase, partial [Ahrensia marina]|uniref:CPBP family intramembrane glutamic endopeptidase n=1 Tax=Ahrensia marina TaxID=1514904 RepID=UPI0006B5BC47